MFLNLKVLLVPLVILCLMISCNSPNGKRKKVRDAIDMSKYYTPRTELTEEQDLALDAQNQLQVRTDNKEGLPMTGTWVLSDVVDRRDVVLVW